LLALGAGFGLEEAAEAFAHELDAYEFVVAAVGVADMHDAALGGEVDFLFFAAGAELGLWDANLEVRADGYVEARDERGAASAKIFAGSFFLKIGTADITTANGDR
jgi:hypothetical protein